MNAWPVRGRTRRASLALVMLACVTMLCALVPALAAPAAAATPQDGRLLLDRMTRVLREGDTLAIDGRLQLPASERSATAGSRVTLFAGSALGSRGALHARRDAPSGQIIGSEVGTSVPVAADGSFSLRVPAAIAPWHAAGVYPLTLLAQADVPAGLTRVASLTTFLPYFPGAVPQPAGFDLVVPVTSAPRMVSPGVLLDAGAQDEVRPGGRLDHLLGFADSTAQLAGADALTLAVDPEFTDVLHTMASGRWLDASTGRTMAPDPAAGRALERLQRIARRGSTMLLPYSDVDVTALAAAGRPDHVINAVRMAREHAPAGVPATESASDIGLPAGGCTTAAGFSALEDAGQISAIVNESCLPGDPALTYTPSAHARVLLGERPLNLLVTDSELDRLITAGPSVAATPRAAEQQFLAETAMIVLEQPHLPRSLIAAVPRNWNPAPGWLATVLHDASSVPWLSPQSAEQLLASPEVARGNLRPADSSGLPVDYLNNVASSQGVLTGVCTMLPASPATLRAGCELPWTFLGPESVAYRTDLADGRRLLGALAGRADIYGAAVKLAASPEVTLTSRSGKVPVVLENNLDDPVTVRVTLEARDRSRLRSAATLTHEVPAHQKVQVEIEVHAEGAGRFPAQLMLLTPSGIQLGHPLQITIRSTAYGLLAIGITAGALGVLLLAVLIRTARRLAALRARHRATTPPTAVAPRRNVESHG